MVKKIVLLLALASIGGCGHRPTSATEVDGVISHVVEEESFWGCVGTRYVTYIVLTDNRRAYLCGNWGAAGDKISGYWIEGGTGDWSVLNGFSFKRPELKE